MKFPDFGLPPINWFGLIAGVLTIAIPFLGPWWVGNAGTGAMVIELSPFDVNMSLLGVPIQSSMVGLFLLAAKITFTIAGIFILLSSIFPKQWWSKRLFAFGVMKPFSNVIYFVALLVVLAIAANTLAPSLLSSGLQISAIIPPIVLIVVFIVGIYALYTLFSRILSKISRVTEKPQLKGNILLISICIAMLVLGVVTYPRIPPPPAHVSIGLPYVAGTTTSTIQLSIAGSDATITAPVTFSLTGIFWLAVATGILGIVARIYHRSLAPPERLMLKPTERKIIAVKPTKKK